MRAKPLKNLRPNPATPISLQRVRRRVAIAENTRKTKAAIVKKKSMLPLVKDRHSKRLLSDDQVESLVAYAQEKLQVSSVAEFFSPENFKILAKKLPGNKAAPKGSDKHLKRWRSNLRCKTQSYLAQIVNAFHPEEVEESEEEESEEEEMLPMPSMPVLPPPASPPPSPVPVAHKEKGNHSNRTQSSVTPESEGEEEGEWEALESSSDID